MKAANCLTEGETSVAWLLVRGMNGPQIARHLGLSIRTVHDRLANLRIALGAHTTAQAAAIYALRTQPNQGCAQ